MKKLTKREIEAVIFWFEITSEDIQILDDVKTGKEKLVFWSEIWRKIAEINAKLNCKPENIEQVVTEIKNRINENDHEIRELNDQIESFEYENNSLHDKKKKLMMFMRK